MIDITGSIYLCYHRDDQEHVDTFLRDFDHLYGLAIGREESELPEDILRDNDKHSVIHKIRDRYLKDSIITLVLLGPCTYTRRSVDLELMASLHHGDDEMASPDEAERLPNGLLGIMLPNYNSAGFPDRLNENLQVPDRGTRAYAEVIPYPQSKDELTEALREVERARTERLDLVDNSPHMFSEDRACIPPEPGEQFATKE